MLKRTRRRALPVSGAVLMVAGFMALGSGAFAASVEPVLHENTNVFCAAPTDNQTGLGLEAITKFENPSEGESTQDGITVDLDVEGGTVLGWDSGEIQVGAVIVKGGPHSNVYLYPGGATSDTDLVTPLNPGGNQPAISHVEFCAAVELEPTETPTQTPTETPTETPTVLPTIVDEEEDDTEVLGEVFTKKPEVLATTGIGTELIILLGAAMLILGFALVTANRRLELVRMDR